MNDSQFQTRERILRIKQVVSLTGLSRTTIWRLERKEIFPSRKRLSESAIGYLQSEIESWISNCQTITASTIKPVAPESRRGRKSKLMAT
ncbi:AlpA family phage regulatory protein [Candidatus Nomurabacteria bacterium]|nr:AlpA family phage regulatory protein [Candidatus Nomurabacteria bacterium]